MVRYWLCTGVCLAAFGTARGDEPAPVPAAPMASAPSAFVSAANPAAVAKPAIGISSRKRIEALLAKPANLDFGDRETITVKELLDKLREQHQLSIRFDMPTLAGMYGEKRDGESKSPANPLEALTEPLSNALPMRIREANHSQTVEAPSEAIPAPAPPASGPEAGAPAAGASYPPASTAPAATTYSAAASNYPTTSAPAGSAYAPYPSGAGQPYPATGYPAASPNSAYGSTVYGGTVYGGTAAPPAAAAGTTAPAAVPVPTATPATAPVVPLVPAAPAPAPGAPAPSSATTAPAPVTRTAATVDGVPAVPQFPSVITNNDELQKYLAWDLPALSPPQSVATNPHSAASAPPLLAPPSQVPAAPSASDSGPIPAPPGPPAPQAAPAPQVTPASATGPLPVPQEMPAPVPQFQPEAESPCHEPTPSPQRLMDDLLNCNVDIRTIDLKRVSVATALRHALDALPTVNVLGGGEGSPIIVSNCTLLDYLVEPDGVQITTRLKALTYKETRVYSLKNLPGVTPEQAATVIRQAIRPWSWRSRIDELGEQLRGGGATAKAIGSLIKPTIQEGALEAAASTGISLNAAAPAAKSDDKKPGEMTDAEQAAMFGNAIVNCVVTYAHTMLTGLEIVHYADPPTGSIQTLPGKLVITQSQAAHREIAELLEQLAEE